MCEFLCILSLPHPFLTLIPSMASTNILIHFCGIFWNHIVAHYTLTNFTTLNIVETSVDVVRLQTSTTRKLTSPSTSSIIGTVYGGGQTTASGQHLAHGVYGSKSNLGSELLEANQSLQEKDCEMRDIMIAASQLDLRAVTECPVQQLDLDLFYERISYLSYHCEPLFAILKQACVRSVSKSFIGMGWPKRYVEGGSVIVATDGPGMAIEALGFATNIHIQKDSASLPSQSH